MLASFQDYLPLDDLAKIVAACLVVAVVAPSAVSLAILGLDRRARALSDGSSEAAGDALIIAGVALVVALIGIGLYTLFNR